NVVFSKRSGVVRSQERWQEPNCSSSTFAGQVTWSMTAIKLQPDTLGHWGPYGGRFVPETLMAPLEELTCAYLEAKEDPVFQSELASLLKNYAGRPTPLFYADRLTKHAG